MVGEFDNPADFHEAAQLGVANYGQMTAGGWMYIGPQGIVHGTYLTLLNAGRLYLGIPQDQDLAGRALSELRSGRHERGSAEGRRHRRGGEHHRRGRPVAHRDPAGAGLGAAGHRRSRRRPSPGRRLRAPPAPRSPSPTTATWSTCGSTRWTTTIPVELASDQTSCHAAYEGGYVPQGLDFAAARALLARRPGGVPAPGGRVAAQADRADRRHGAAGHPLLGLRQQLPQGGVRGRRARGGRQRRRHQGGLRLPLLRGAHHGPALLRPGLRAVPLGLRQPRPGRPGRAPTRWP